MFVLVFDILFQLSNVCTYMHTSEYFIVHVLSMCTYAWICVGILAWVGMHACTHMLTCICIDIFLCTVYTY